MASSGNFDDENEITEINVTPLVDVMLVLLVIFMVTANYITQQAIPLELPKAATGEDPGNRNLNFTLDRNSNLFIDGEPSSFADLSKAIKKKFEKNRLLQAIISADKNTPHGSVVKLMDIIKKNGITDIAFNVEFDTAG
ncbi:MAG: biopolymer transporter ExbD [Oligoflexales bacterium]|nr:biopolymer transporter ExbD [Oligoflexales bacterium]